jgi:hypothetical protein
VIVDPVSTGSLISRPLAEEFAFPYTRRLALMNAARLYGKWPIDPERLA